MGGRKPRSQIAPSSGSESGDSESPDADGQPDQWVVDIVASTKTNDGKAYYLVRWGADDSGKAYKKGQEEETWEPAEHVHELEVSQSSATVPLLMSLASIFSTTRAVERSSTRLFCMTRARERHAQSRNL